MDATSAAWSFCTRSRLAESQAGGSNSSLFLARSFISPSCLWISSSRLSSSRMRSSALTMRPDTGSMLRSRATSNSSGLP